MIRTAVIRLVAAFAALAAMLHAQVADPLRFPFGGKYGQVEVGGPFVGAEFHGSRPLPSRISLYYPVANSIDVSNDYWKRGASHPFAAAVRLDGGRPVQLGTSGWAYTLSPHAVTFDGNAGALSCAMTYQFCAREPAMVFRLRLANPGPGPVTVEAYTHLRLSLRSCQTYARFDSARTEYDIENGAVIARFDNPELSKPACFVQNAGARPASWTTNTTELGVVKSCNHRAVFNVVFRPGRI